MSYPLTSSMGIFKFSNLFSFSLDPINLKIPIVLFHGTQDEVVPLNFSRKILKICKKSKKKLIIVKNGDHSLSKKNDLKKIYNELNHMTKDYLL